MSNKYLERDEFEILRPAPNAEILWPMLRQGEVIVLDAAMLSRHAFILCENKEAAMEAIQSTLFSTLSQTFQVCRLITKAPQGEDES